MFLEKEKGQNKIFVHKSGPGDNCTPLDGDLLGLAAVRVCALGEGLALCRKKKRRPLDFLIYYVTQK